jgi:hypothetical protein
LHAVCACCVEFFHLFILSLLLLFWLDIRGSIACRWRLLRSIFYLFLFIFILLFWQDIHGFIACRSRLLRLRITVAPAQIV